MNGTSGPNVSTHAAALRRFSELQDRAAEPWRPIVETTGERCSHVPSQLQTYIGPRIGPRIHSTARAEETRP